jgi:hypothetical protein
MVDRMPRDADPRDTDDREEDFLPDDSFVPAQTLPTPNPQEGYVFRWIRVSSYGDADITNVSARFREGWVPVKQEDHPELHIMLDLNEDPRFEGNVLVGGLMLCKMDSRRAKSRDDYYSRLANSQIEAVDNNLMREEDPRMPLLPAQRRTRTTFGSGTRES